MEDKIAIGGREYRLGYNLRVRMIYEKLTGKGIGEDMLTFENVVFLYAILVAFNKGFTMDIETLTDALCEDESIYPAFLSWLVAYNRRREGLAGDGDDPGDGGKKKA